MPILTKLYFFFFLNNPATPEIYTLPLHAALPISPELVASAPHHRRCFDARLQRVAYKKDACRVATQDRKSTRLNSSHSQISYAVFCLKKKKNNKIIYKYSNSYN